MIGRVIALELSFSTASLPLYWGEGAAEGRREAFYTRLYAKTRQLKCEYSHSCVSRLAVLPLAESVSFF